MDDLKLHNPTAAFSLNLVFPGGGYFYLGSWVLGALMLCIAGTLLGFWFYFRENFVFLLIGGLMLLSARGARVRAEELNREIELEEQRAHRGYLASIARNTRNKT